MPTVVLERLQGAAAEWRESRQTAAARSAGILGWKLRVAAERITLRARIRGRNALLPHFTGRVEPRDSGSVITGEMRLNPFSRVFAVLWLGGVVLGPLLAFVQPVVGTVIWERLACAIIMVVPCAVLFIVGASGLRRSYELPAFAFKKLLFSAARGASVANHSRSAVP